ncbi:hypothetical protein [Jeotgalicoccus marinus]|uniref:hypothetical protein n=1 Tax=Jeotgalicoccus marinus TaxID=516700 RepID=UPI0004073AE9|nr:hypothetical protein [Jeotgalicoccus marinus]
MDLGNYEGTISFMMHVYDLEEAYDSYLNTLSLEQLEEEKEMLEIQLEIINSKRLDH